MLLFNREIRIMAAATTLPLMTVEEFDALPQPRGNFTYELHFGRLVKVGRAKKSHYLLQCFIRDLIKQHLDPKKWFAEIPLPACMPGRVKVREIFKNLPR